MKAFHQWNTNLTSLLLNAEDIFCLWQKDVYVSHFKCFKNR